MENNVTALQWFLHLFIIMSSTVLLSIIHKAASTQPVSRARSFLLQCPGMFPCHFIFCRLSPSPRRGRMLEGDTRNSPVQKMPASRSPHPSVTQHLSGCFMYPLFLTPVSADKRPGHRCSLRPPSPRTPPRGATGGDGAAPQDPMEPQGPGTTRPWLRRLFPGLNPASGAGCRVAKRRGFPGGAGRDRSPEQHQGKLSP